MAIKKLFDTYITPKYPDKIFNHYCMDIKESSESRRNEYIYTFDGVYIHQYTEIICYLNTYGDDYSYAYFFNNTIRVDEVTILDTKEGYSTKRM